MVYIESYCRSGYGVCTKISEYLWMCSIIFVPIFVVSLINIFLRISTFNLLRKFTVGIVAVHFLLVTMLPYDCQDFVKICKESIAYLTTGIYICISLAILLTGWWKGRAK
jgi:hypothetical protein